MERMGEQELTDWMAFYQLEQEDEKKAVEDAKAQQQ
jgi:hypothetical protein